MKILSNFKDYYDNILGFGSDESIVYNRFVERRIVPLRDRRGHFSKDTFPFNELPLNVSYADYYQTS